MPHYAAGLKGDKNVLEEIAPCFNTALSTIWRHDDEWIMESSNFEGCQSIDKVYTVANALLMQIHQVLALYLGLASAPLSIGSIMIFNGDVLVRRRMWGVSEPIWVYKPATETLYPTASGSLATAVLSLAASDSAVREALSLGGNEATWPRVYDIIEFLGGPRSIEKSGFAPQHETRRVKQTANYYRHLGNPKRAGTLPPNPPTLRMASFFAINILQKWIATKTNLLAGPEAAAIGSPGPGQS